MRRSIITLTTDFGTKDGYVGAVKGVIKRINPQVEILDITHQVDAFDVLGAAFVLSNFYKYFPQGSIHLVVVDPGVGGQRQPLLIKSHSFFFVGPDNGVFSFIYQNEALTQIRILSNKKYFLAEPSSTFHARDILAPVAAYLSLGVDEKEFGKSAKECMKLMIPEPKSSKRFLSGEIIHVDNFGNLITNIQAQLLQNKEITMILAGKRKIKRIARSYFDIPSGEVGALVGSSGFLEIASNQKSAQKILKSRIGTKVKAVFA
jgi:hypothetical protein